MSTIHELKKCYKEELSDLYSENEIATIYSFFIEKIVGFNSFHQRRFMHQELLVDDEETLKKMLSELKTGKPYQQILGETEFYGMLFFVNENVLVPRPETEELLEIAIQKIRIEGLKAPKILEIGTGSGIIPIVLKKNFPEANITSIDFSEKALEVAKKNAEQHKTNINFIHDDYLAMSLHSEYDIIISNPPYIGINEEIEISNSVKNFEPTMALFSPNEDALIFYRKIAEDAEKYLKKNGFVFLEINQKLGNETLALYSHSFSESSLIKDLSSNDRFVIAKK